MKKTVLFISAMVALACLFAISISAEVTTYDDAPAKTVLQVSTNDVAVFDDGFVCPSAYICKDQTGLSLDFSWINGKTGKAYTVANVVELDIPQGTTFIGQYYFTKNTTMKKCSIPDSVTKMEQCVFQQATALEELVMEHDENDGLTEFSNWTVWGCSSLKAFSMPDCVTAMTGVAQFNSCTNLKALYLSKNLVSINSGAGNTASFGFCPNLFFVNEPFTYDNVPTEKPEVYYFPSGLTSLPSGGELFKNSTSLNDVLVFPTGVTELANGWAFCNSNAVSVVFLGDMVNVSTTGNAWNNGITIYFCNEADKSAADLTGLGANCKKVYCYGDGNTSHIKELSKTTEATCTLPAMSADYCFCGQPFGTATEFAPALGHDFANGTVTYTFGETVYDNVSSCTACARECGVTNDLVDVGAIMIEKGYSSCDIGGIKSFTRGYTVKADLLAAYEEYKGVSVEIGYAFAVATDSFDTENPTLESFAIKLPLKEQGKDLVVNGEDYNLDYIMQYKDDTRLDSFIIIAGYVLEGGNATFGACEKVSYNSVAKDGNLTVNQDGSVDASVDIGSLLG